MLKLLIAVDGSENALRAVRHVIGLARRGMRVEPVVINVQPPLMAGEVGTIAPAKITEEARAVAAAEALGAAQALFEQAGVPVVARAATGDAAEAIAAAAEVGCDGIVMGRRGLGPLASLALGSVSSKVIRLAEVPVTLVK